MKKVLFFIIAMVCAALNVQASISVWPTSTNGVEGYGIYDWDNPGDIAAFLNGSYQGTVYYDNKADANWKTDLLERVKAAETVKLGGNADSPKEPIGTADLQALEHRAESDKRKHGEKSQASQPGGLIFSENPERIMSGHQ